MLLGEDLRLTLPFQFIDYYPSNIKVVIDK